MSKDSKKSKEKEDNLNIKGSLNAVLKASVKKDKAK